MQADVKSSSSRDWVQEGYALAVHVCAEQLEDLPAVTPASPEALRSSGLDAFMTAMNDVLMSKAPDLGLEVLQRLGAFAAWLPEVDKMVGFGDGEWRHKDVWKHTKQVVKQSVRRPEVRWGALLHDIGKPRTRKIDDRGRVTFHGHAELGAAMFRRGVAPRLGFEGPLYERIHFLILHHLRASQYKESWTDNAVRRFYVQMGDGLRDLLDLSRADITTKRRERKRRGLRQISLLSERIRKLQETDSRVPPLPKGLGADIMRSFGVPPSKLLGDIRKRLEQAAEAGEIEAGRDANYYLEVLAKAPEVYGLPPG